MFLWFVFDTFSKRYQKMWQPWYFGVHNVPKACSLSNTPLTQMDKSEWRNFPLYTFEDGKKGSRLPAVFYDQHRPSADDSQLKETITCMPMRSSHFKTVRCEVRLRRLVGRSVGHFIRMHRQEVHQFQWTDWNESASESENHGNTKPVTNFFNNQVKFMRTTIFDRNVSGCFASQPLKKV